MPIGRDSPPGGWEVHEGAFRLFRGFSIRRTTAESGPYHFKTASKSLSIFSICVHPVHLRLKNLEPDGAGRDARTTVWSVTLQLH